MHLPLIDSKILPFNGFCPNFAEISIITSVLSIIICSRSPELADKLRQNIASTVGVPFECIIIDNSTHKHSIFSAYNEGIKDSRFPYLCFPHEDVVFKSHDWGQHLCNHLLNPEVGIIGLCGSSYQSRVPASWSLYDYTAHIIQSDKRRKLRIFEPSDGYDEQHEKRVVGLDGVFLAARKELFNHIAFDEHTFNGFNAYDLDICVQAHVLGYTNLAINDILLIHFSKGHHGEQWIYNILRFVDKWQDSLPIQIGNHSQERIAQREVHYMKKTFLKNLVRSGYSNQDCKHLMTKYLSTHPSFVEWVRSPQFKYWLYRMRLKKNPLSLIMPPASRIAKDASSIV